MPQPITISEEAKALLRIRMASSGFTRPLARIAMNVPQREVRPGDEDDADWTIRRRDLWTLRVEEGQGVADGDPRLVMVDGLGFVCDLFPMRFDISARGDRFSVAAAA